MKIYLYSPETGIYQGEDFADGSFMERERHDLAEGCTAVAPPKYGNGQVPVFHAAEQRWEIRIAGICAGNAGG